MATWNDDTKKKIASAINQLGKIEPNKDIVDVTKDYKLIRKYLQKYTNKSTKLTNLGYVKCWIRNHESKNPGTYKPSYLVYLDKLRNDFDIDYIDNTLPDDSRITAKDKEWIKENYGQTNDSYASMFSSVNGLLKARDELRKDTPNDLSHLIQDDDIIERFITEDGKAETTLHNRLKNICSFIQHINNNREKPLISDEKIKRYRKKLYDMRQPIEKKNGENEPRVNVGTQNLVYQDMIDAYDYWEKKAPLSPQHVYMACILFIPVRRLDWRKCVIIPNDQSETIDKSINYVFIGVNGHVGLLFNKFKTSNKLLAWEKTLSRDNFEYYDSIKNFTKINPEKLAQILTDYSDKNPEQRYLFCKKNGDMLKSNVFSKFINNAFKKAINKNVCNTDLRQIFITHILNNKRLDLNKLKAICRDQGQDNLTTQYGYYALNDESINELESTIRQEKAKIDEPHEVVENTNIKFDSHVILFCIDQVVNCLNNIRSKINDTQN